MARKRKGQKTPSYGFSADKQNAKGKRIENYEDTLEEGGVDDFMFKRDQIMFDQQDDESEEDLADVGEEVMAIPSRKRPVPAAEEDEDEDEEEDEDEMPVAKKRVERLKPESKGKGRFGKPIPDSDDSASDSGSGSGSGSESEEEGWGRQYYSVPSTRREKEKEGEYDEKREEERDLEEREVRRLQRKAREALSNGDYGLDDEDIEIPLGKADGDEEGDKVVVPLPESTDPAVLLRHMEVHEPVKLALAREWPLVVRKLEKTQRGMKKLEEEKEGQLHKGLGWLHYQETLLSYASTLAFYIHLSALPSSSKPDLASHPILTRLLELKKGLSDLETLDFDAASVSGDPLVPPGWASDEEEEADMDDEEKELRELIKNKKDLIARLLQKPHAADTEEDDLEEEEEGVDGDEEDWKAAGLEDRELEELMRDAEADMHDDEEVEFAPKKKKKASKKDKETGVKVKKDKKSKSDSTPSSSKPLFSTLAEPAFFSNPSSSKSSTSQLQDDEYEHSDPLALLDADAEDKERRKRSLAFHTSKIASTANRRAAAREKRNGGDEDIPYRDRQAARDAALRKQTRGAGGDGGEALDGREMDENDRKRAREVREEMELDLDGQEDDGEGYYDLIKRSKASAKAAKIAAHEQSELERMEQLREVDKAGEEGPRSLTRAIEKNRGLTPRRSKAGRNPRVKKRLAYEKAKQKVGSQRAVFKGGQASLDGRYQGEKTGISTVVKSRQF